MATRADLRTRARVRADQDNSTFPTDTQFNYWLDAAGKETWYDLARSGWPLGGEAASATISSSGLCRFDGELSVTDPVAFVTGVYRLVGGTYTELKRLNEGDRAALMSSQGSEPCYYDLFYHPSEGLVIQLYPMAGAQVLVQYVSEWPGFSADDSVWRGPARSDELIVLKAAAKACRKEGNDQGAAQLDREYLMLLQSVQELASWTNMRHPATIRDVGNPLGRSRLPGDFDVYGPDY